MRSLLPSARLCASVLGALALVALLASTGTGPAGAAGNRKLFAQVGTQADPNAFSISLKDSAGQPVGLLGAGNYDIQIDDWASAHNFHLFHSAGADVFTTPVIGTLHTTMSGVSLSAGSYEYQCDPHASILNGSFTVVSALAPDGSGTMSTTTRYVSAGGTGRTISFTYKAGTGGMGGGAVSLVVPSGWSAPSTTGSAPGFVTATKGSVSVASRTITVTGLTLTSGATFILTYGAKTSGGPGATATSSVGTQTWQTKQRSTSDGVLTNLATSPAIQIVSADGSGTVSTPTSFVPNHSTGNTISFTYTAAAGGTVAGVITLTVPSGWSAPSTTGTAAGYSRANKGTLAMSGQKIILSKLTLSAGSTVTITYGSKALGGPGATAPSTGGIQTWWVLERSAPGGTLKALSSPHITVLSPDGAGTMTTPTTSVARGSTGRTIVFTYTAAAGGVRNGGLKLLVPAGWSVPSTVGTAPGYSKSSAGALTIVNRTIVVTGLNLLTGQKVTITYGSKALGGPGATAPGTAMTQTWTTTERSSSVGIFKVIASSPQITIT
jgi:hypothetical protein